VTKSGIPITIGSLDVTKFSGLLFVNTGAILGLKTVWKTAKGCWVVYVGCSLPRVYVMRDDSTGACQTWGCSD